MPKDKRKGRKAVTVQPPLTVHAGEVLGTLHTELANLMAEAARYRLLVVRLDAYERDHPERAAHVRAFVTASPVASAS